MGHPELPNIYNPYPETANIHSKSSIGIYVNLYLNKDNRFNFTINNSYSLACCYIFNSELYGISHWRAFH